MLPTMDFGDRLRELRKSRGFNQEALGELLGASKQTISHWEGGRYEPNLSQLLRLCEVLQATPEYLLTGQSLEGITPEALSIARWFDRLTDRKDRAVAETGAMGAILRVLQQIPPKPEPGEGSSEGTPPAQALSPEPAARTTPTKIQTDPKGRLVRRGR
jgi:transcriptional regulator with XRE-family HTH domain